MRSGFSALLIGALLMGWGLTPAEAVAARQGAKVASKVVKKSRTKLRKVKIVKQAKQEKKARGTRTVKQTQKGLKARGTGTPKKPKKSREQVFQKRDQDGNGVLTLQEFEGKKARPEAAARFEKWDRNGDGKLTLDEFRAPARGQKKKTS